jgi:hypothetical protein
MYSIYVPGSKHGTFLASPHGHPMVIPWMNRQRSRGKKNLQAQPTIVSVSSVSVSVIKNYQNLQASMCIHVDQSSEFTNLTLAAIWGYLSQSSSHHSG